MWTISVLHIMMQSYANDRLTSILRWIQAQLVTQISI
jgi:hypothetical protein